MIDVVLGGFAPAVIVLVAHPKIDATPCGQPHCAAGYGHLDIVDKSVAAANKKIRLVLLGLAFCYIILIQIMVVHGAGAHGDSSFFHNDRGLHRLGQCRTGGNK